MPHRRIPSVDLSELVDGQLKTVQVDRLFAKRRALVIGMPGAFTPSCHQRHMPDLIASIERLTESGYDLIVCITPNDPWINAEWARQLDPDGKVRILSDGNLSFGRALGLTAPMLEYHLGARLQRFLMTVNDGQIDRLQVEASPGEVGYTAASALLETEAAVEAA